MSTKHIIKKRKTLLDRLPKTELEYQQRLLYMTERAIKEGGGGEALFKAQAEKIRKRIKELK